MDVLIKETGKVATLALIDPNTGNEGFAGFVERLTGVEGDEGNPPEMPYANYCYWQAMLTKEQEGIDFIHEGIERNDDSIHGLIIADLREAATYSPIDTINAQAAIIKRLKLGKVVERKNDDLSSSIKVLNLDEFDVEDTSIGGSDLTWKEKGHKALVTGNFTLRMPNRNDDIDFTAKLDMLYFYDEQDKCICDENWDFPMAFSSTQEEELLNFLHTALRQAFVDRGLNNSLYAI